MGEVTADVVPFDFHGQAVRTVDVHGEPWFVARDVCAVLGINNPRQAASYLDHDEKGVITSDTPGGPQDLATVSEAGLYSLILRSRKPEAKAFKRWVTHDVLPEIRKRGQYGGLAIAAIDRKTLAQWVIEEANRADAAEAKVAELEPQAAVARDLMSATGDMSVREAAQALCRAGIPTGERRLFAELKRLGWISDSTHAYQRAIDLDRIRVRMDTWHDRDGEAHITRQIRITPKGVAELHRLFGDDGPPLALVASP